MTQRYEFWQKANERTAPKAILTGHDGTLEEMPPTAKAIETISRMDIGRNSVLDFGCGAGRNMIPLAKIFDHVDGVDWPNMIQMAPKLVTKAVDEHPTEAHRRGHVHLFPLSAWETLREMHFDLIFTCLVLQHLHPDDLREKLKDFRLMTSRLFYAGRAWTDFVRTSIFPLLTEHFRVVNWLGSTPDSVLVTDDSSHFSLILEPRL